MPNAERNEGLQPEVRKPGRRIVGIALTASLALNMFGLGWFATQALVKNNVDDLLERSFYSQTQLNREIGVLEGLLVRQLTANLSPQGVEIFMDVYRRHMSSLNGMDNFLVGFHANLVAKIRSETVTEQELREALNPLPLAVMKRVSVMTDILAEAIPLLSNEDRMKLPPMRTLTNE